MIYDVPKCVNEKDLNITSTDIQAEKDGFPKIAINKVGIKGIELPIWIKTHDDTFISTMAEISSYCDLVEDVKGINMSRIIRSMLDVFNHDRKELVFNLSKEVVDNLQEAHETDNIYFKARFKYPYFKKSPMTQIPSPETVNVVLETTRHSGVLRNYITIEIVGMSLCPCSKDMSLLNNNLTAEEEKALSAANLPASLMSKINEAGFGAHNQKSFVKITAEVDEFFDIEDLIRIAEASVSSQTFSVLKRPDEKYVTEVSYMGSYINGDKEFVKVSDEYGPKFVEDISRAVADKLNKEAKIKDYVIVIRNEESIHSNNIEAVAVLNAGKSLR
jgi:GTP cyclohydrolase I